jgi:hypothetical protein
MGFSNHTKKPFRQLHETIFEKHGNEIRKAKSGAGNDRTAEKQNEVVQIPQDAAASGVFFSDETYIELGCDEGGVWHN